MPYNHNYFNSYQPYVSPHQEQFIQNRQNLPQQYGNYNNSLQQIPFSNQFNVQPSYNSGIIWVQGEEGAKAFSVAPGNSALLMDSDKNCFYIKSVDTSGVPQPLRLFDYSERVNTQKNSNNILSQDSTEYITREEFDKLQDEFQKIVTNLKNDTKKEKAKGEK